MGHGRQLAATPHIASRQSQTPLRRFLVDWYWALLPIGGLGIGAVIGAVIDKASEAKPSYPAHAVILLAVIFVLSAVILAAGIIGRRLSPDPTQVVLDAVKEGNRASDAKVDVLTEGMDVLTEGMKVIGEHLGVAGFGPIPNTSGSVGTVAGTGGGNFGLNIFSTVIPPEDDDEDGSRK